MAKQPVLDRKKAVASVADLREKYGTIGISTVLRMVADELKETSAMPSLLGEIAADLESALKSEK